jgi:hypothetical protein
MTQLNVVEETPEEMYKVVLVIKCVSEREAKLYARHMMSR